MSLISRVIDIPADVDSGIKSTGLAPDYSQYGNDAHDMRRVVSRVGSWVVRGVINQQTQTIYVHSVHTE